MSKFCRDCEFSDAVRNTLGRVVSVVCKRYPPATFPIMGPDGTLTAQRFRPTMELEETCGEFKPQKLVLLIENPQTVNVAS